MSRSPDERDMEQAVRSWMRDDDERPADRNRQIGRIIGRADETRQRRGAWRLLPFGRGTKSIDRDDDELVAAGRYGLAATRRAVAPSLMAVVAVLALVVTGYALLYLQPTVAPSGPGAQPSPSASPSPAPQPTMHPADEELRARLEDVWSGERTGLDAVQSVYTEDAIHTALWHDEVERFEGQDEIWARIQESRAVDSKSWIPLPDSYPSGERRYLAVSGDLNGIACVLWVDDARISRHDCLLPRAFAVSSMPSFEAASPASLELWEEIRQDFTPGWGSGDLELIERVVSPEIIHHVAHDNREYSLEGITEYMSVMGYGEVGELAPPVALPAPEGEARWTDFSSVSGGSLCTFWARDGLVVRHDCVLPQRSVLRAIDEPLSDD